MPKKKTFRLLNKKQNNKSNKRINVLKNKQPKKTKKKHPKQTRRNILMRKPIRFSKKSSLAGEARARREPRTRHEKYLYNYEKQQATECVTLVYNLLGNIAASRQKVAYLLDAITASGHNAELPTQIDEWNAVLEMGSLYRYPNTEFLKKNLMDPLVEGSIINLANMASDQVKEKKAENVSKAERPINYASIKTDINEQLLDVLNDPNYVTKDDDGWFIARPDGVQALDIVDTLFPSGVEETDYDKSYSIKPIRAILRIAPNNMRDIADMLIKAQRYAINSNHVLIAGILKRSNYGFPRCNNRHIPTLEKLHSVYEEIFNELIRYVPSNMFKHFEGESDVQVYYNEIEDWENNRNNMQGVPALFMGDVESQESDFGTDGSDVDTDHTS